MTAFDSQPPMPDGQDPSQTGRITVSMRGDTARSSSENDSAVSPWLYVAGLIVTLAALYAVNFGLEDSGFAMLTYVLATVGYCASYFLRARGISLRGVQVPLLTLLGFFFLLSLLFGQGVSVAESPSRNLQIALTWVAILHSYTLSNNAAVLFACVPGMTLIALVSTSTTEIEAQNAFLVFFCAATFLLVHENYLRTQAYILHNSETGRRPLLFASQFGLAIGCFLGAILLARLTVWPMEFVGSRLFPPGTINAIRNTLKTNINSSLSNYERTDYELAMGPISATETPILEVTCDEPLYWRAGTFDTYTGHSFKNTALSATLNNAESQQKQVDQSQKGFDPNEHPQDKDARGHFQVPPGNWDLPEHDMTDSHLVPQHFKILAMSTTQISGAARIKELDSPEFNINTDDVGGLNTFLPLQANAEYDVVSVVPSSSPEILRAAPAYPTSNALSDAISRPYLKRAPLNGSENQELANLAAKWTQGLTNNYDKVLAIQHNIAATCQYNLSTPAVPRDRDIVQYFLTESHQGYCDSFGAAMTMMCRYAGIPARMALGFLPGDETKPHTYLVKDKDRHIWTEVFFPTVGWVKFDATEGATDVTPQSDTSHKKTPSLLAWLAQQSIGLKVIELIVALLLAYLVKTELLDRIKPRVKPTTKRVLTRPPGNVAILAAYHAGVKQLARKGLTRAASMTAVEFGTMVHAHIATSEIGTALTELTELHNRYYYSNETAPPEEVLRAQAALHRLTEALRQIKGAPGTSRRLLRSETA